MKRSLWLAVGAAAMFGTSYGAAKIAKMQAKGEAVDRLTLEEVQDAERAARERVIDGVRSSRAIWA